MDSGSIHQEGENVLPYSSRVSSECHKEGIENFSVVKVLERRYRDDVSECHYGRNAEECWRYAVSQAWLMSNSPLHMIHGERERE